MISILKIFVTEDNKEKRMFFLLCTFLTISLVFALHSFGTVKHLYWIYPWYDILVHSIGGAAIASLILSIRKRSLYIWTFLTVMVSAISWEIFENIFADVEWKYFDALTDIAVAVAVSMLVIYSASRLKQRWE